MNTKKRHLEILAAAKATLSNFGGTVRTDDLEPPIKNSVFIEMAKLVEKETECHINTAKRNLAKAMRQDRYRRMQKRDEPPNWGGHRPNQTGRPRKASDE